MTKKVCLVGLVFACVLFFGHVGTVSATSIDIVYDGYCDGAHLDFDFALGLAQGYQTGCASGDMLGTVGLVAGQGFGLVMGYSVGADAAGLITVIRGNGTWTHYVNNGAGISVMNEGTWSPGVPPAMEASLPSSISP